MTSDIRNLTRLLQLIGGLLLCATLAVFLPREWLVDIHQALGLGTFPAAPVTEYLARTIAAIYALHGGMLLMVSRDVVRHAPLVCYLAVTGCAFGAVVLVVDIGTGMPIWWIAVEGPSTIAVNLLIVTLLWRARFEVKDTWSVSEEAAAPAGKSQKQAG